MYLMKLLRRFMILTPLRVRKDARSELKSLHDVENVVIRMCFQLILRERSNDRTKLGEVRHKWALTYPHPSVM
jgi:hypothetical protein